MVAAPSSTAALGSSTSDIAPELNFIERFVIRPVKTAGLSSYWQDPGMIMAAQVSNIVKSANFHLINIGRARRFLTDDATKLAIHTLVTYRLDYCNSLLIGSSSHLQRNLQNIQRTSARMITKRRKFDSITNITAH